MNLDIVIPCLNEEKNLESVLPFLRRHTLNESVRIIVADSHQSADNSAQICANYNVEYVRVEHTQRSRQLNAGARHGQGDMILFLHADVRPPADFLQQIESAVEQNYEAGFFCYRFDRPHLFLRINAWFTQFDGLFAGGGDQCHFIKRAVFDKLGGYDNDFVIMEDFAFFDMWKQNAVPYTIIRSAALVSARKYVLNSYLRVNLLNLMCFVKFRLGHEPSGIRSLYQKYLR